jgi:hypothetical protein
MMPFQAGDHITWMHQLRDGYGYLYPVDGTVVRAVDQRLVIQVPLKSGELVERRVHPDHLRLRGEQKDG